MIGWAAVTNSVGIESILLFAIIFIWTPPHFWALALYKSGDYKKAGIPMMPIVAGNRSTQRQILAYSLALAPLAVLPYFIGFAGIVYAGVSVVLGAIFVYLAFKLLQMPSDDKAMKPARKLFGFSIFYLFAIFATLLGETIVVGLF